VFDRAGKLKRRRENGAKNCQIWQFSEGWQRLVGDSVAAGRRGGGPGGLGRGHAGVGAVELQAQLSPGCLDELLRWVGSSGPHARDGLPHARLKPRVADGGATSQRGFERFEALSGVASRSRLISPPVSSAAPRSRGPGLWLRAGSASQRPVSCDIVVTPSGCCGSSADDAPPHDIGCPFQIEKCQGETLFITAQAGP
jgi:hypothetical protein